MLEAFIDIKTGNVIVVKPIGSVWGSAEINQVIRIKDDGLEAKLGKKEFMAYPYSVKESVPQKNDKGEIIKMSAPSIVEISLVKVKVNPTEIQSNPVLKQGILRANDATTPVAIATIDNVIAAPNKTDILSVITKPDWILPVKGKQVVSKAELDAVETIVRSK